MFTSSSRITGCSARATASASGPLAAWRISKRVSSASVAATRLRMAGSSSASRIFFTRRAAPAALTGRNGSDITRLVPAPRPGSGSRPPLDRGSKRAHRRSAALAERVLQTGGLLTRVGNQDQRPGSRDAEQLQAIRRAPQDAARPLVCDLEAGAVAPAHQLLVGVEPLLGLGRRVPAAIDDDGDLAA